RPNGQAAFQIRAYRHRDLQESGQVPTAQPRAAERAAGTVVPVDRQGREDPPSADGLETATLTPASLGRTCSHRDLRACIRRYQLAEVAGKVEGDAGDEL